MAQPSRKVIGTGIQPVSGRQVRSDQDRGRIARPVRRGAASQARRRCHFRQRGTSVWVAWRHVYLATVGFEWRSSTSQVLAVEAAPAVT